MSTTTRTPGRPKKAPAHRDDSALDLVDGLYHLAAVKDAKAQGDEEAVERHLDAAIPLLIGARRSWRTARAVELGLGVDRRDPIVAELFPYGGPDRRAAA